ncbi:hypothetical protein OG785_39285 [Streptomyces sp. NBC_00006]|uniref:hypothetical protein n=1 Tax=unclassified Streptomyces TaxID=2593676 RepID=UPI002257268F|nr:MULTISPECIES: hypothetical protein [unclassified Streptomyces]MCX4832070.1 hypothetical protein [Streptomyces sp. NBC_01016]MCX5536593.1 hypothetical protein [Streptomyces sp. NBC_00006]
MRNTITEDLVQTQREWDATYRQLADRPGRTALRRRLLYLSRVLAGEKLTPAQKAELRRRARGRA